MRAYEVMATLDVEEQKLYGDFLFQWQEEPLAYIAWAETNAPAKAVILRARAGVHSNSDRQALRDALDAVDPHWSATVLSAGEIRHCGLARDPNPIIRFKFVCSRSWDSLEPTENPDRRQCDRCNEAVFLCTTREEVAQRARDGQCVSVPSNLASHIRREVTSSMTGRPDYDEHWARSIFRD